MDNGCRKAILCLPRQVGKDTMCSGFLFKEAVTVPGNYFYIFPTKEMARKAVWEKVMDDGSKLLDMIPERSGLVKRLNNQEMVMELTNNSTIRLIGLDKDPDAGRGITPQGIIFSEFAFSDPEAYANVLPALRRKGAWVIINSTPNGRNHFYSMLVKCKKDKSWFVSHMQALWPNIFTWEDIEREYGCSFATSMKGSIYADHIERAWKEDRIGRYLYDDLKRVHTFWDLGVDDDTVVWFMQKQGNSYVFIDYLEDNSQGFDFFVRKLVDKGYNYGTHYLPHDADNRRQGRTVETGAELLSQALRDVGLEADYEVLPKLGVQEGIEATRKKFKFCCFDSKACNVGLKRLELYHRKART
jgi:hypothetical protein